VKSKPLQLPPKVAKAFVKNMRACFAEGDQNKRDAIAAHQLSVLSQYQGPREKALRLSDVKAMFREMKGIVVATRTVFVHFTGVYGAKADRKIIAETLIPQAFLSFQNKCGTLQIGISRPVPLTTRPPFRCNGINHLEV
jgi:hypothetical protein